MLRSKVFLLAGLLGVGSVFLLTEPAQAQRHGGHGGHGGGHGGHGFRYGGGHGGHGFRQGGHGFGHGGHGFHHGGRGFGHGLGHALGHALYDHGHYYPYRSFGYGYSGYYAPRGSYYDSFYSAPYYDDSAYPAYGYAARRAPAPAAEAIAPVADDRARLRVILPDPDAQIWVEGRKTNAAGQTRTFWSPPLSPGERYTYTVTAAWNQEGRIVTEERRVPVVAGNSTVIDFTRPAAAARPVSPAVTEAP